MLLLVSAFMLLGFVRSGASFAALNTIVAVLVSVALPAIGGVMLLRTANRYGRRSGSRADQLRRTTIESEILRLAMLHDGRLTAVEVASALALPSEEAKAMLDGLVTREVADLDITDAGVLVYSFHELTEAAVLPLDNEYWHDATEAYAEGVYAQIYSLALVLIPAAWLAVAAVKSHAKTRSRCARARCSSCPAR